MARTPARTAATSPSRRSSFDERAFLELAQPVRARDDGQFEVDLIEVLAGVGVFGRIDNVPNEPRLRQWTSEHVNRMALLATISGGANFLEGHLVRARYVFRVHNRLESPGHVLSGDGLAVAPPGPGVEPEGGRSSCRRKWTTGRPGRAHSPVVNGFMSRSDSYRLPEQLGREAVVVQVVVETLRIRAA